jgi:predicted MFS family arabinose efflux permease
MFFTLGTVITALAPTFAGFLVGRAITGIGAGGIVACTIIIVLDLASDKTRGLYLGLVNTGFTAGVSLGAVVAGALVATTGWVSDRNRDLETPVS